MHLHHLFFSSLCIDLLFRFYHYFLSSIENYNDGMKYASSLNASNIEVSTIIKKSKRSKNPEKKRSNTADTVENVLKELPTFSRRPRTFLSQHAQSNGLKKKIPSIHLVTVFTFRIVSSKALWVIYF